MRDAEGVVPFVVTDMNFEREGDSAAEIASKVTGVQKVVKVFKYLN